MKQHKRLTSLGLAFAMALSLTATAGVTTTEAKAKKPALTAVKKTMDMGQTFQINMKSGGTKVKSVSYSSSKTSVATVSQKGLVKAIKTGTAKIKAVVKANSGKSYTLYCQVTVRKAPVLIQNQVTVNAGETTTLTVNKNGNAIQSITWASKDKAVATVSQKGVVTGVAAGSTTVTAIIKSKYGKTYSKTCSVKVMDLSLDGGWQDAETPVLTDEQKAMVTKATQGLVGATYEPMALLATQVVSGMNYHILCRMTTVTATPKTTYVIGQFYEDPSGNAELVDVAECGVSAYDTTGTIAGGYMEASSPEVEDEVRAALEKSQENLVGVSYEARALVAAQVVAGMNYCILCKKTTITPDMPVKYTLTYVNADLNGNATMDSSKEVEFEFNSRK